MDSKRRYSEEEVAEILDRATDTQSAGQLSSSSPDGLTLAELQDIGQEVGIPTDLITRAAESLERTKEGPSPQRAFLGATIGVGQSVDLPRRLTDAEWSRLVVDLRETFDARGNMRDEGAFRQWTNGNLQALLEPTESGERLRLKTLKGDARASLGVGALMMGAAPIAYTFSILTGAAQGFGLMEAVTIGVIGGLVHGVARVGLPRWADVRMRQMESVIARLTAATQIESGDE